MFRIQTNHTTKEHKLFPLRVTIFGESAGSASIGHLLLSDVTTGLFAQGIGQSGSALASWAFDDHPEEHALKIASKVGCIMAENGVASHDDLVACLRELPAVNISHAFNDYMKEDRLAGGMGFGGSIPCAQTKGEKRFYTSEQTPEKLLHSGHYEKVSINMSFSSLSLKVSLIQWKSQQIALVQEKNTFFL